MKIQVPAYALRYNLNDYELLFCNFMAYLSKDVKYKDARYYMYADDIKHMLGYVVKHPSKNKMVPDTRRTHDALGIITKVFKFGIINDCTYTVEFIKRPEYEYRNGALKLVDVEITEVEVMKLYYYLVGRLTSEDIIDDNTTIDRVKKSWTDYALKPFFREHFMI